MSAKHLSSLHSGSGFSLTLPVMLFTRLYRLLTFTLHSATLDDITSHLAFLSMDLYFFFSLDSAFHWCCCLYFFHVLSLSYHSFCSSTCWLNHGVFCLAITIFFSFFLHVHITVFNPNIDHCQAHLEWHCQFYCAL